MLLALRYYGRELARLRWLTAPAMPLRALGNIGIHSIALLVVAKLVGRIAGAIRTVVEPWGGRRPTYSGSPGYCWSPRRCGAPDCTA